jgi:hypothetical protein
MIGYRLGVTRTIARLGLIALSLWLATGCTAPSHQATVVLRFQNVRTFVEPDGKPGESEWDVLNGIARRFHVQNNIFGIEYEQASQNAADSPPGVMLRDYTVRLVVADLKDIARIEQEVVQAANRPIGRTGERAQFGLSGVTMDFRGAYVSASIAIEVFGRVDPGSRVFVYPHGTTSPVEAVVNAAGSWNVRVQVREGADYIYGYASHPRSPNVRKCFRVNIYTRQNEPVIADEFDRLRSQQP